MERKAASLTHSSNSSEPTRRGFDRYLTHQPFPCCVVRESPSSAYKMRVRRARKAAEAESRNRRIGPKDWKDDLQKLINENNSRHATKPKGVSNKTREERATFLHAALRTIYESDRNFNVAPRNLGDRHVKYLVEYWLERGLKTSTIHVYLSYLRMDGDNRGVRSNDKHDGR